MSVCSQPAGPRAPGPRPHSGGDPGCRRQARLRADAASARAAHQAGQGTSNVCTNQTLMAIAAAVHLSWLGPEGLARLGGYLHPAYRDHGRSSR